MTYLILRGDRARRREAHAHLASYDRLGRIVGAWCGASYNLTSNVPWGLGLCKHCARAYERAARGADGGAS